MPDGEGQDLDVPVRSTHADPLPVPDQPGSTNHLDFELPQLMLHPTTAGKPYSRAITAPWYLNMHETPRFDAAAAT